MSTKKQFIKGGMWLTIGYGLSAVFSFLRNIILARLVSVEDYGIASLFAITMAIIEMLSNIAIDKLLVQTKGEQLDKLQAVGQMFQFFRGLSSGLLIYLLAKQIAEFFQVPDAVHSFEWFALVPIVRGLAHLDIQVLQRRLEFAPVALSSVIPHIISLIALVVLGKWLGNYTVIVWVILIQNLTYVLLTFYYAEKKYHWTYDKQLFNQMISFGWPLLANGFLMFIIMQGDKAIIGAFFTTRELGWYSAAFALSLAPALVITRLLSSLLLPVISKWQNDQARFFEHYVITMQTCYLSGLASALFFIFLGPQMVVLLFGPAYQEASDVVVWLGLMQSIRIIKAGPMIVAMAKAETKNAFISNLVRAASFSFLLVAVIWFNVSVNSVALLGLLGEGLALFASIYYLKTRLSIFDVQLLKQLGLLVVFVTASLLSLILIRHLTNPLTRNLLDFSLVILLSTLFYWLFLPELKERVLKMLKFDYSNE